MDQLHISRKHWPRSNKPDSLERWRRRGLNISLRLGVFINMDCRSRRGITPRKVNTIIGLQRPQRYLACGGVTKYKPRPGWCYIFNANWISCRSSAGSMTGQRRRRWPIIGPPLTNVPCKVASRTVFVRLFSAVRIPVEFAPESFITSGAPTFFPGPFHRQDLKTVIFIFIKMRYSLTDGVFFFWSSQSICELLKIRDYVTSVNSLFLFNILSILATGSVYPTTANRGSNWLNLLGRRQGARVKGVSRLIGG